MTYDTPIEYLIRQPYTPDTSVLLTVPEIESRYSHYLTPISLYAMHDEHGHPCSPNKDGTPDFEFGAK